LRPLTDFTSQAHDQPSASPLVRAKPVILCSAISMPPCVPAPAPKGKGESLPHRVCSIRLQYQVGLTLFSFAKGLTPSALLFFFRAAFQAQTGNRRRRKGRA